MKRSMTRWTMGALAAVLLAVPTPSVAQTSGGTTPQTQTPTSTAASTQVPQAAREHLSQAKAALNDIDNTKIDAKARTQLTELKKRMTALERAIGANDSASATGQANRNPSATANRGNTTWGTEVAAIDKALTTLIGPASTTGAATTPPATGTAGTAGSTAAAGVKLDETTRTKLTEVRTHITAFATAMAGGKEGKEEDPSAATGSSASSASSASSPTMTSGTATSGTATSGTSTSGTATSGTAAQQPPTDPQTSSAATPQVDQEAARRHLTEARNTLSAMTQLPAAAQLQGDARTHITQLITNFNELITTQSEWRATYGKLESNLAALLGPDPEAPATSAPTGTAGATGTTGTAGTTGATAGTSGTGVVDLDPGIREKLVELRRNLNAFEKAAGAGAEAGATAPSATSSSATSSTPVTSGSSSASGTSTPTTPPTASSATSSTTGTSGTTPPEPTQAAPAGNADIMKHIAAIDAMLRMQDDSGGLTLTKAQVEQLRTHWAALRASTEKR